MHLKIKEYLRKMDADIQNHCLRTGMIMEMILAEIESETRECLISKESHEAFFCHDIGKIGIPEKILIKTGKLNGREKQIMQKHCLLGAHLFRQMAEKENLILGQNVLCRTGFMICAYHHEYWDGSGYPFGCQGKEIPFLARICAVADSWDAMTHDRAYRLAIDPKTAMNEIQKNSGTQFDPWIVNVFLRLKPELLDKEK